ncbi:hypothetical protein AB205_0214660 [Aquarana catesbeiana]|uniref:Uncharacterized protein n=1 Tax=Aquarana catesbeiana TaxID=8400 RepID=A0A2G9RZK4_AQUCT|nr:hypothetical protein AB205_0214660 [Aquarana catesbeiana]
MEECSERHKDLHGMMEPSSTRNSSERCPCPLNSQDYTQEDHNYTYHNQGEDLMDIKVEIKAEEEETYVRDDQQSMKEDGIAGSFIEEDTPTEISTVHGWGMRKSSEDCLILSPDCKSEDEDITQYCLGEKPASSNAHLEEPHNVKDSAVLQTDNRNFKKEIIVRVELNIAWGWRSDYAEVELLYYELAKAAGFA